MKRAGDMDLEVSQFPKPRKFRNRQHSLNDIGFKYIIVIIDTFTRYVELFPEQEVTAIVAAIVLSRHTCRFTAPIEIVTDFGSQFMNQLLTYFNAESGIKHNIPRYLNPKKKTGLSNGLIRRSTDTYATYCLTKVISKTGPGYFE